MFCVLINRSKLTIPKQLIGFNTQSPRDCSQWSTN